MAAALSDYGIWALRRPPETKREALDLVLTLRRPPETGLEALDVALTLRRPPEMGLEALEALTHRRPRRRHLKLLM